VKIKFVYLGTGTFGNPDLLIMDEPTNDLDLKRSVARDLGEL
jgi:ATPase subunit of ABC transporter with duplicated ATPase domains